MSVNLDRFGGPEAWDAYCADQDFQYSRLIADKVCTDCDLCTPELNGLPDKAFCAHFMDVIDFDSYPAETECGAFTKGAA